MPRRSNPSVSETLRVTLAAQSVQVLDEIAKHGIYGKNSAEVAARFVEERLREFTAKPVVVIKIKRGRQDYQSETKHVSRDS